MIGCVVQARTGSSRLSNKVLKIIDGENPVLYYVLKQLKHSKFLKKTVVATTKKIEDEQIINYLKKMNFEFFRGNEKNVLDRYYQCSKKYSLTTIVRITGDNPLIDPSIMDKMINEFERNDYDYMTNAIPRTFPYGTEVEIFSFHALETAWKNAKTESEKEHVTQYFHNHPEKFKIRKFVNKKNISFLRWTLDEKNDLILIQNIIKEIKKDPILLEDILELYSRKQDLFLINKNVKHNVIKNNY